MKAFDILSLFIFTVWTCSVTTSCLILGEQAHCIYREAIFVVCYQLIWLTVGLLPKTCVHYYVTKTMTIIWRSCQTQFLFVWTKSVKCSSKKTLTESIPLSEWSPRACNKIIQETFLRLTSPDTSVPKWSSYFLGWMDMFPSPWSAKWPCLLLRPW